jgi:hypothetical protein
VIERVTGGLPSIGLPAVSWKEIPPLLRVVAPCFLMIIAQSAATARAYASLDHEILEARFLATSYACSINGASRRVRLPGFRRPGCWLFTDILRAPQ